PQIPQLANHRTASHVIQRSLTYSDERGQAAVVQALLQGRDEASLINVALGRYGSFVIEQLAQLPPNLVAPVRRTLEAELPTLVSSAFGRRVAEAFEFDFEVPEEFRQEDPLQQQASNMSQRTPWQCTCGQRVKASASFCGQCGGPWDAATSHSQGWQHNHAYTTEQGQPPWHQSWWPSQPASPRRRADTAWRPQSPRRRPKGQPGKGKGKKGAGKDSAAPPGVSPAQPLEAPSLSGLPTPPAVKAPARTITAATPASQTSTPVEEKRLLAEVLANIPADQLPPELQRKLGQYQVESTHQQGRHMHRLVSEKVQLRKELEQLRADRSAYNAAWEAYVLQLLELWSKQGESRLEAMTAFAEREADLSVKLANATQALASAANDGHEAKGPFIVDDDMDEDEASEVMVATAVEVEAEIRAKNQKSQDQIREHNVRIQGLLQQAHQEAAAAVEATKARDGSRTPRRQQSNADAKGKDEGMGGGDSQQPSTHADKGGTKKPPG
ncbi:PUF3, partial [Symbiodinium microadriaticum]